MMEEKEKIIDDVRIINGKLQSLSAEKRDLFCRLRDICCPFKLGDIVRGRHGKAERKIVMSVISSEVDPYYKLRLSKIKNDGKPYRQISMAGHYEGPFIKSD